MDGDISLVLCISTRFRLETILSLLVKYLVIFQADTCNKSLYIIMSVCRMSVVCQINCVGGITYGTRACSKSFFWWLNQRHPCYSFRIRLSFSMDEKEAEARPVMGTIFLVN